jgi:hypothetical protein
MTKTSTAAALIALALSAPALAQQHCERRLGDHPAVVVQRLHKQQGYDYASKFYPHPAWLYLLSAQPGEGAPQSMAARPQRASGSSMPGEPTMATAVHR